MNLAGFDFVLEISQSSILNIIKRDMTIGSIPLRPPFELTLSMTGGSAHLIVNDLQLDLDDDDTLVLHLVFSDSSSTLQSLGSRVLCPLSGSIAVRVPFNLQHTLDLRQATINMAAATITISWTEEAEQAIASDLAGSPVTPVQFKTGAQQAVLSFITTFGLVPLPLTFFETPGTNGSLVPLVFTSLEMHCIGAPNRSQQALAFFGNLLVATQTNGDHTAKTTTDIAPGREVAISLAPGVFHTLIFCPNVMTSLGANAVGDLPPSCGTGNSFEFQGMTITNIADQFSSGHININGQLEKSGFCYEATGSFHAKITLSVNGSTLTPEIQFDPPDVDFDIPWYCFLTVGAILGPIQSVLLAIIEAVIDNVVDDIAGSMIGEALGNNLPGVNLGNLGGTTFSSVVIEPAGLLIQGDISFFIPESTFNESLYLDGSTTTSQKNILSTGILSAQLICMDEPKDYPYTEYSQTQVATYDVFATMLPTPFTVSYRIKTPKIGGTWVYLEGNSGTLAIPDVDTTYALPFGSGGTKVTQTVYVDYERFGTGLKLRNRPEDGNYSIYLEIIDITSCAGDSLIESIQSVHEWVHFNGNVLEMGGSYLEDYQECLGELRKQKEKFLDSQRPKWEDVPIWVKVNHPAPEQIYEHIRMLTAVNTPEMEMTLVHTRLAHGTSFSHAFHAPAEIQLGRRIEAGRQRRLAANATKQVQIKAAIAAMTKQLDTLQSEALS